ncbi:hypothetical protein BS47DRAFT_1336721 [Hydnum rufescens UP504]|uniref:histone acetyltransferase n=1 Tax=Hydnum rufescens UP504 TaxID=1448309 RepID=A0A9P6B8B2_9AGAM|nr:hypothetical protein BS47DRAFT_1336721 [Hydnum rufescens UP504]
MPLKQFLLDALSSLPGARTLHLYNLVASPTRDKELFVYAPIRPKIHVRHHLVLLAQHAPDKPTERVFICAIEAFLYTIPSTSSAILYISKVDSSGQAEIRPNPTRALVTAFLEYYSSLNNRPAPNLWIHVFARAQNQYLFPNSAEHPGKRVLRDISLCKWWKDLIEQVARKSDPSWRRLPHLNKSFTSPASTSGYPWTYSHPYHQTDVRPPCGDTSSPSNDKPRSNKSVSPAAQRALAAVPIDEFWERIAYRQECSQGAITGFFTALFTAPNGAGSVSVPPSHFYEPALPPSPPGEIITMLMNLDFGTTERARRGTSVLVDAIHSLCDKGSSSSIPHPQASQPRPQEEEPPEGNTSIMDDMAEETPVGGSGAATAFEDHIYGCVVLDNPPLPSDPVPKEGSTGGGSGEPPVTILQVRKKKRPVAPS